MREYGCYWFDRPTLVDAPEIAKEVEIVFTEMTQIFEDSILLC